MARVQRSARDRVNGLVGNISPETTFLEILICVDHEHEPRAPLLKRFAK